MGEPKYLTEAQKAELREGIRAGVKNALAANPQADHVRVAQKNEPGALNADESRGRGSGGNGRELSPGEIVRLERDGAEFLDHTGKAIEDAKGIDDLMKLVIEVNGKGGRKLSLKMENGLSQLLLAKSDFSRKFNELSEKWRGKVLMFYFGKKKEQEFQLLLQKQNPSSGNKKDLFDSFFAAQSLPDSLFLLHGINEKLNAWWDKYFPGDSKKDASYKEKRDSSKIAFSKLVALWKRESLPFTIEHSNGEKITVTQVTADRIEYDHQKEASGQIEKCHITPTEIDGFLAGFQEHFGFSPMGIRFKNKKEAQSGDSRPTQSDSMGQPLNAPTSTLVGTPGDNQSSIADVELKAPVKNLEPLVRSYEDLLKTMGNELLQKAEVESLSNALSTGFKKMMKGITDDSEGKKFQEFLRNHEKDIIQTYAPILAQKLRTEQYASDWSEDETQVFSEEVVRKKIKEYVQ